MNLERSVWPLPQQFEASIVPKNKVGLNASYEVLVPGLWSISTRALTVSAKALAYHFWDSVLEDWFRWWVSHKGGGANLALALKSQIIVWRAFAKYFSENVVRPSLPSSFARYWKKMLQHAGRFCHRVWLIISQKVKTKSKIECKH